jgi:hypothetical protein
MLLQTIVLLRLQRGLTFFVDEWQLLVERRRWDVDTFLTPLYEHLFLVPIAVFKLLMLATGIGPHWVFGLPLIALHMVCVGLVYQLARPRLGPWFALAPAALILFLGSATDDLLLPIQVSFLGSVAAGLGMLLMLDGAATRRRDTAACILLALSLASSSVGFAFAAVGVVEVLRRPGRPGRVWVVGVPIVLYAAWFVVYGPRGLQQGGDLRGNVPFVPAHVADAAAAVFGAVSGLDLSWGRILAVLGVLFVIRKVLSGEQLSSRLVGLLLAALVFWTLGGLARGHQHDPEASRYLYPGAVFVVLCGVELLRSAKLGRRWAALLAVGVAFAAVGNANTLRGARDTHQVFTRMLSAQWAALEVLGRDSVPPDFVAAVDLAPGIRAEGYFDMVDELGSPVDVRRDLLERGEQDRRHADAVLAAALAAEGQRDSTAELVSPPPIVAETRFGSAALSGPCVQFEPIDSVTATLVVTPRGQALLVRASPGGPVSLAVRRFSGRFHEVTRLPPSSSLAFPVPRGGLATPWQLRVSGRVAAQICTVADSPGRS